MTACVYRFYGAHGELLYVGLTASPGARFSAHAPKPWWPEVASITLEHFADRSAAKQGEALAIAQGCPRYNLQRPIPEPPEWFTVDEMVERLDYDRRSIWAWAVDGLMDDEIKAALGPDTYERFLAGDAA